jgi:2-hydroxymethylglutarate dehydrogenase
MSKDIGFIGLGAMGRPMATRLIDAGCNLVVFDISKEAMTKLEEKGARSAISPKEVAEKSEIVFTMLPDSPEVEAVVLDRDGTLAGAKEGLVLIDTSTDTPSTSRMIAEEAENKKVHFLGASVSGTPATAASGAVRIYVGGKKEVFEKNRNVLEILASEGAVIYMGDVGTGEAIKIVNNLMSAINMVGIAEGFSLGVKLGLQPQVLFDMISKAGGNSWMLENKVKDTVLKGEYEPAGFRLDLMIKDVKLALQTGRDLRAPLPISSIVQQMYVMASATGRGNKDVSAVANLYEELAGVKLSVK